jgi:hypothetical protein
MTEPVWRSGAAAVGFGQEQGQGAEKASKIGDQTQLLTAAVTATAARSYRRRPETADNARTIRANLRYVRPEKRTVGHGYARDVPVEYGQETAHGYKLVRQHG